MSKRKIILVEPDNSNPYRFYDDYTYDTSHWGGDSKEWKVVDDGVWIGEMRLGLDDGIFSSLAREAHYLIQFDKQVEETLTTETDSNIY